MRKALLLLMLIVAFSGRANAQGCSPTISFSDYDSVWAVTGPSGYPQGTVYRSYQITGSAQMITEYCPGSQNAQHHEVLSTSIGSASNSLTTSGHCVTCSFNDTVTTSLNMMPGDGPVSGDSTSSLVCSIAGTFYSSAPRPGYFEGAGTYDQATGAGTPDGTFGGDPVYQYNVVHYCTNGTPDYNPSTLDVNEPNAATDRYFFASAILFRISTTSTWSVLWPTGGATTNGGSQKASPPTPCTHTGPQI
jgi:hypothetical protein